MKIAIDGPSGAGKSLLAKSLAARLGIIYVDTGALYRTIGLYMYRNGIEPTDRASVAAVLPYLDVRLGYSDEGQRVYLSGEDVSAQIREPQISMYASAVSAIPEVRDYLLDTQRNIAAENSVIMDGRDIGTVILPDADVKIFLTASNEARASRRYEELKLRGTETTYDEVLADIIKRDRNDSTRSIAPAVPAADAIILDNSGFDREETFAAAIKIIEKKLGKIGIEK